MHEIYFSFYFVTCVKGKGSLEAVITNAIGLLIPSVADIKTEMFKAHIENLIGSKNYLPKEDLFELIKEKEHEEHKPRLYMWCGAEDFLYQDNVKLKKHIQQFDYDYTYRESAGVHSWEHWDAQIQNVLEWMFVSKE